MWYNLFIHYLMNNKTMEKLIEIRNRIDDFIEYLDVSSESDIDSEINDLINSMEITLQRIETNIYSKQLSDEKIKEKIKQNELNRKKYIELFPTYWKIFSAENISYPES